MRDLGGASACQGAALFTSCFDALPPPDAAAMNLSAWTRNTGSLDVYALPGNQQALASTRDGTATTFLLRCTAVLSSMDGARTNPSRPAPAASWMWTVLPAEDVFGVPGNASASTLPSALSSDCNEAMPAILLVITVAGFAFVLGILVYVFYRRNILIAAFSPQKFKQKKVAKETRQLQFINRPDVSSSSSHIVLNKAGQIQGLSAINETKFTDQSTEQETIDRDHEILVNGLLSSQTTKGAPDDALAAATKPKSFAQNTMVRKAREKAASILSQQNRMSVVSVIDTPLNNDVLDTGTVGTGGSAVDYEPDARARKTSMVQ